MNAIPVHGTPDFRWTVYATAYKCAGDSIVEGCLSGNQRMDLMIYPACANYRHSIELFLKNLASLTARLHDKNDTVQTTHQLVQLWRLVKKRIGDLQLGVDDERLESCLKGIEKCISEFDKIDKNGNAFRYPVDTKGYDNSINTRYINLSQLRDSMHKIAAFFSFVESAIDEMMAVKNAKAK